MTEISDRVLTLSLITGIAVLLVVTVLNISNLKDSSGVTGFDTLQGYGNVNASVTSNTAINLTNAHIDFGTGTVSSICTSCEMNSTGFTNSTCCDGFNTVSTGLVLENIGNKNVSVNSSIVFGAAGMIGGTNPVLKYYIAEGEVGSCNSTANFYTTGNIPTGGIPDARFCNNVFPEQSNDEVIIHIIVGIPDDSNKGLLNNSINFTATTVT